MKWSIIQLATLICFIQYDLTVFKNQGFRIEPFEHGFNFFISNGNDVFPNVSRFISNLDAIW
jgi:hypothetical protein